MIRTLLLALVVLFACVPAASSARRHPDPGRDPQVRSFVRAAAAFWGESPRCRGGVGVVRSQWSAHPDAWASAIPRACWIALDPDRYPRPAAFDPGFWAAAMCSVIAHEWGHLLGRPHSPDPRSVMSAVVPLDVVPGCAIRPRVHRS